MFTAPCWAIFSVAAWVSVWRWPALRIALVAAAGLYALSYGTSLAATFSHSYPPLPNVVEKQGYAVLGVSLRQTSPTPPPGGEADLAVYVENHGTGTALSNVDLKIRASHRGAADRPPVLRPRVRLHRPDNRQLLPRLPARRHQLDRPVRHADRAGGHDHRRHGLELRGRCPSGRQQGFTYHASRAVLLMMSASFDRPAAGATPSGKSPRTGGPAGSSGTRSP